jgi:aldehyde dehydrogenase (NAD+)
LIFVFEVTQGLLGPIMATGNTVVVKPAPDTPWNATRLGRLIAERTDIPAGVVNIVAASDHLVGEDLTLDPRVDLISFTGSTVTGKRIMEKGAETLKRVFLELGGKSPMLMCEDADFASILPTVGYACMHGGQGCAIQTRILLPRSRYAEGVEIIKASMENVPYGDPTDPANIQGPQISAKQRDRIMGYIQKGIDEGANLVVGGRRPPQFEKGYFVEPTLFTDVDNSMTIAQEEIFGPVVVVIPYEDEADAIRIANDSMYGLSAGVFAGDLDHAMAIARKLRTGSVGVNGGVWYGADSPYGGYKSSGIGRQNGIEGFNTYLETKLVGIGG